MLEEEKEKLIKEHAPNLAGFLHPDLVPRAKKVGVYQANPSNTNYL
jgi:hypothetical protein